MQIIDSNDKEILKILQQNARTPNAEIARRVGLAPSAIFERIRKLEERGIVDGYTAHLNARALGQGLLAFVFVRSDESAGAKRTSALLSKIPEVQEVHHVAGEDCFLVKVRAVDTHDLGRVLRDQVGAIKTVRSTRTTIVLETIKETAGIYIRDDEDHG